MNGKFWLLLIFSTLLVLVPTAAVAQDEPPTIVDLLIDLNDGAEPEFTILLELLDAADLLEVLADPSAAFTIFAPTDAAFEEFLLDNDLTLQALLDDPQALQAILLYHVTEGALSVTELPRDLKVMTLQGLELTVTRNVRGKVLLDAAALVQIGNLVAGNGMVHTIDYVLLPIASESGAAGASEPCMVRASGANVAQVRVGPGENRTSVSFLPADTSFAVTGRAEANDGSVWFQLNKDEAAPGRSINEAWVAAAQVTTSGDCEQVGVAVAPPVIPIISQPPAQPASTSNNGTESSGDPATDSGAPDAAGVTLPQNGSYSVILNPISNASCQGTGNFQFNTLEIWESLTYVETIQATPEMISFSGDLLTHIGDGVYRGQVSLEDGFAVTIFLRTQTATFFYGEVIGSFTYQGVGCSYTGQYTATKR